MAGGVTVKICGVRDRATAEASLGAGADWVGAVLADGPRRVTVAEATALAAAFPGRVVAVLRGLPPTAPAFWDAPWGGLQVYDVAAAAWVPAARARGFLTIQPGRPGVDRGPADVLLWEGRPGRGERLPWGELTPPARPFWLAGGLTPDNVAEALRTLGPDGVDVSSGVEDRPGQKDLRQVRRFIEEVRRWTRAST
jgi:phosphoribosylanthranilate isomerase